MLDLFSEIMKTIEIGSLSQWTKANVGCIFQNSKNHWIWVAFAMKESQCWTCFWNHETIEIGLFSQWTKANVRRVIRNGGNHWIWVAFIVSENQCWTCFQNHKNHWIWVVFEMTKDKVGHVSGVAENC
jgi:hypothetical protein